MFKKIITIVLALMAVFALSACGTDLALDALKNENRILKSENEILAERISDLELELNELSAKTEPGLYKLSAKAELNDYVFALNKDAYIDRNWAMIKDIVAGGKTTIDAAKDKAEVDGALSDAIAAIDEVERKVGKFYSLQEAYAGDLLTREDIMHISYFDAGVVFEIEEGSDEWNYKNWIRVDFEPKFEKPILDTRIADDIKKSFYENNRDLFKDSDGEEIGGVDSLKIYDYFGKYGESYVVIIKSDLWNPGGGTVKINIAGIIWESSYSVAEVFVY